MHNNNFSYNPKGSKLRRDQEELLRMLLVVDNICKKHNIQWWLSSGTLLGAARHKGFIPWDDDMDIVLLKKDYKRLENILINLNSEDFVFHCSKTDTDYINVFGKFRKRKGQVQSNSIRYDYYKWKGIGFDIFAIEKTNSFSVHCASKLYSNCMKTTLKIKSKVIRHFIIKLFRILNYGLFFPILRLIGLYNPQSEYHYVLGTGWPKHTFYVKHTFPLAQTEFEGHQMPVPFNMDEYLTLVYGDWRKQPSDEDIMKSIHCKEYRDEILARRSNNL